MRVRTFTAERADQPRGGNVWFNLHYDAAGNLIGVEEHDSYQGGPIENRCGSWDQTFLDAVQRRAPDHMGAAAAFLHTSIHDGGAR